MKENMTRNRKAIVHLHTN